MPATPALSGLALPADTVEPGEAPTRRQALPAGGATGAYLRKGSASDYDDSWETHPSSGQASNNSNVTNATTTYQNVPNTGVVFTAPASGRVLVEVSAAMLSGAANSGCIISPVVRVGSTIGSGTVVLAAADANVASNFGTSTIDGSRSTLVTGLTPGTVYHAQMMMRSNTTTQATTARQRCVVIPLLA